MGILRALLRSTWRWSFSGLLALVTSVLMYNFGHDFGVSSNHRMLVTLIGFTFRYPFMDLNPSGRPGQLRSIGEHRLHKVVGGRYLLRQGPERA